jgi:hypothetical protein
MRDLCARVLLCEGSVLLYSGLGAAVVLCEGFLLLLNSCAAAVPPRAVSSCEGFVSLHRLVSARMLLLYPEQFL